MTFLKRRAGLALLALLCILTGISGFFPLPAIQGQAFAAAGPDLLIESISWSPEQPNLGSLTGFTVTVKNQGDAVAGSSRLAFFIDSSYADYAAISPINPGNTATVTFTWRATAGEHIVKAIIDNEKVVPETDENNNEKLYAFSVLAADLIVDAITWTPEKPSFGYSITFMLTVKNAGNKAAGVCWVDFLIDGTSRGMREGQPLNPGASFTLNYTWIAQPGQHILQATADTYGQVTESNEVNNDTTKIYCTTPPDLIVESITYSPATRTETSNVTMSAIVKNQGEGAAIGSWLDFYIDDKYQTSVYIKALEPGQKDSGNFTWAPGPEAHIFKAVIDGKDVIFESNESNNSRSVALPALGLPDLLIQSLTWSPATPLVNSRMTFNVTVKNNGARTVDKCNLYLYITYGWKLSKQPGPIPPGGTITVNFPWITSEIPANIRAVVDEEDFIKEADETNNEQKTSLTPAEPVPTADYALLSITCTPDIPAPGEYVNIKIQVKNQGSSTAPAANIACYVDDVLLGFMYFDTLGVGRTVERSIIWKATTGEHIIKAVVDYNNLTYETNEANNEKTAAILTTAPDLAIEKIEWFPTNPITGNDLDFRVTIKNQGARTSGHCYLTYYIDGAPQGTHYLDDIEAGASVTRHFSWIMQSSSLTFTAAVDVAGTVDESDETNNEKSVLLPAPDITLENITCSEDYPIAGMPLTFTIYARNTGISKASSVQLTCYIDGNSIATLDTGDIDAGQIIENVFTWIALPGKHTLHVIADEENTLIEINEADNAMEVIIFVPLPYGKEPDNEDIAVSPNETAGTEETAVPDETELSEADIEELFGDLTEEEIEEISGNISATPDTPSGGIKDMLMNKWLLIGVAIVGLCAIGILVIIRKRSDQPGKEKQPKPPKPPKAEKQPKAKDEKKAKPGSKTVPPAGTLSGKPPVLVPPPPKPAAKPGMAPPPIVKPAAPPNINTGAGQNLGATLLKQSIQQQQQKPPQGTPPAV